MWKRRDEGKWGRNRVNVDDLEMMKLSIHTKGPEQVDDHMAKILEELQNFSIG